MDPKLYTQAYELSKSFLSNESLEFSTERYNWSHVSYLNGGHLVNNTNLGDPKQSKKKPLHFESCLSHNTAVFADFESPDL